tara:strand:- start:664 stop:777 length:114 start_codon:yes stop_codon:yes gene_type:complete
VAAVVLLVAVAPEVALEVQEVIEHLMALVIYLEAIAR